MDAGQIHQHLIQKYSTCKSYHDSGVVEGRNTDDGRTIYEHTSTRFETYFRAPNLIRFDWRDDNSFGRVCSDGNEHHLMSNYYGAGPHIQQHESVTLALAGATGVSSGSAAIIPSLLLKEFREMSRSGSLLLRSDISIHATEEFQERNCYCLVGSNQSPQDTQIWITVDEYTLLRYRSIRAMKPDGGRAEAARKRFWTWLHWTRMLFPQLYFSRLQKQVQEESGQKEGAFLIVEHRDPFDHSGKSKIKSISETRFETVEFDLDIPDDMFKSREF